MASAAHRLRKYQRKKDRSKDPVKWNHYAKLYWRYWFKVYGGHRLIWK